MKNSFKAMLFVATAATFSLNSQAQVLDIFNHLSVGVNAGTTGIGVDVAMPVTRFLTIRPGYNFFPELGITQDLDISSASASVSDYGPQIPSEVSFEAKLKMATGKVLVDFYPIPTSGFHLTAGAYFGSDKVVNLYNKEEGALKSIADWNQANPSNKIGAELGDYLLTPDARGNVNASIKTACFRPYLGLGFGRAVPGSRVGFMFELGCQFWGTPKVYCNNDELTDDKVGGDAGDILKIISKVSVYPVINFRLCGKIF